MHYFYLATDLLKFSEISMPKAKSLRSRDNQHSPIDQSTNQFITEGGEPLVKDLIMEIEDVMKETSPVLSGFDLFNPEAVDKSKENRNDLLKTLCDHYSMSINDSYEGQTTTTAPVINPVHPTGEFEDFMEAFDDAVSFLNKKLKKSAKQLLGENSDAETYIETKRTTSADVYNYLAADSSLKQFMNIATLFKRSLLIPPTTSNAERGFSVMNFK